MTSYGRRPQKLEMGISQQPLIGSYPNLELGLMGPSQMLWKLIMKPTYHEKWEYLSNHLVDLIQIWNLGLWDQAKCYANL